MYASMLTLLFIAALSRSADSLVIAERKNCAPQASPASLCAFFKQGQKLLEHSKSPSFAGWNGSHPSYKVPYTIGPAGTHGEKGLGAFVATEVKKGTQVYCDHPHSYIRISHAGRKATTAAVSLIAAQFSDAAVNRALGWCASDYLCGSNSIICEQDDGRFFNNDPNPSTVACGPNLSCMCASRHLHKGEELTENYAEDKITDGDMLLQEWRDHSISMRTDNNLNMDLCAKTHLDDVLLSTDFEEF